MLRGGCYDLTATPPYGPWRELSQPYADLESSSTMPSFDVDRLAPGGLTNRQEFVNQMAAALEAIAHRVPVVAVLEDMHWSDVASLELLRAVARREKDHRILLVVTYRSDDLTRRHPLYQILPLLVRESSAQRIDLHSLSPAAIASLISSRYALDRVDHARLVEWLSARAEGNPFFVEELLHALEDQQLRQAEDGSWTIDDLRSVRIPICCAR